MEFCVRTSKKQEIVDITKKVEEIVRREDIVDGGCLVFAKHATCAVIINENYDRAVCRDILNQLEKIVPEHDGYEHDKIDNNAAAHIKSSILSPSVMIPVRNGKLVLGRWQGIGLVEFDGPRERKIEVKVLNSDTS